MLTYPYMSCIHAYRLMQTSLYWAFTTTATVGYGDITPKTVKEKVVAIFVMCLGVSIGECVSAIPACPNPPGDMHLPAQNHHISTGNDALRTCYTLFPIFRGSFALQHGLLQKSKSDMLATCSIHNMIRRT